MRHGDMRTWWQVWQPHLKLFQETTDEGTHLLLLHIIHIHSGSAFDFFWLDLAMVGLWSLANVTEP